MPRPITGPSAVLRDFIGAEDVGDIPEAVSDAVDLALVEALAHHDSTVRLALKKVDAKKSKFTLNVIADDRTIEKKDRTMYEPLQFYTAKDRQLYEVVVFTAEKNKVTGYLSTPKEATVAQAR